ncbi:preprotein translocase subunit SecA [Natranaerobius trueperi]|uniref:Preprotein translocase subunit SecA n=2 Tax=Natranaerobius trueperi TaxID=759412 RepID=A0A226BWA4_9FIRM|nr:preprotein translocase subunit SecA [Natranaerobius trueperi]
MHNKEQIDIETINEISQEDLQAYGTNFVDIYGDYFVHESILEFNEFQDYLQKSKGKPYYIPSQEELLNYKDDLYFERNKEFEVLLKYLTDNIFEGDRDTAEGVCDDIQGICQHGFSVKQIFNLFNIRNIVFDSEDQVSEIMNLVKDLANNTRLWENNGHTPNELNERIEVPSLRESPKNPNQRTVGKKIGRNEPCPCGSGKKYKKCCLK